MKKLNAVGAYIFAGGFTLGVREHFNILCHLEESPYGVATTRHNMPDLDIFVGPENWPLKEMQEWDIDFLYGNPPCAAWSVAGHTRTKGKDKWKTDPRVNCTIRHFDLLRQLRPKVWAWESVTQAYTKGAEFVRALEADALEMGYSVIYVLHDAQWLGLPQRRKRFFMLCHRVDLSPQAPNWSPPPTPLDFLSLAKPSGEPPVTPGDLRNFPPSFLKNVKPGERLLRHWERANPEETRVIKPNGDVQGRPSYGHYRLPIDRPGNAIVGYSVVHPTEHRFLTVPEMQVLSGFPPDYHFTPGGASARAAELARGVCPPVGEWLARWVAAGIRNGRPVKSPTVRLATFLAPPDLGQELVVTLGERPPARPISSFARPLPSVPITVQNGRKVAPKRAPRSHGSGAYIRELIARGFNTKEILRLNKERFPDSRAAPADVSWQRRKIAGKE